VVNTLDYVRRRADTVHGNPVRLDEGKAEQIIDALQTNLANVYVLYRQVRKHHWNVAGAEFGQLHEWFDEEADCLEAAADEIAERIQALGGVPVSGSASLEERATFEFEGEDVYDVRTSLENDLEMYATLVETFREHVELAENLGDYATGQLLRKLVVDVEEDAHELDHYLENDTLVLESATN